MMLSFLGKQRKCGECKACCTAIAVKELRKPFMAHCEHECQKGCNVYESRPDSCRGYECGWLIGLGPIEHRPDKIGGVIHHEVDEEGMWVQVHLTRKVSKEEFITLMSIAETAMKIAELRGVKLTYHDQQQNCSFTPDLVKYPGFENRAGKTVWKTHDGIHYVLEAPKRIPLKVVI